MSEPRIRAELEAANDAKKSMLPVLPGERIWGGLDFTLVMIAFAIATWTFLTGGFLASIVPAKGGMAALAAGLLVGFLMVVPAGSLGSAKYGVDQYIQLRAMFGWRGSAIVGVTTCYFAVWFNNAAIYPMLGKSVMNIVDVWATLSDSALYWAAAAVGIIGVLFTWWISREGPSFIKKFDRVVVPGLVFVMILLIVYVFKDYGWRTISAAIPTGAYEDSQTMYVLAFDTGIGFGLSWYWLMGSLTRITTTQRVAVGGYYWGTFLPSCAAIFIGMWTGYAIGETDPTKWMVDLAGPVLGIIALIFIIFANISSGAVMIYTGVVALRQFKWARRWSWSMLVFLVALPALLTMLAQDTIYTRMGMVMAVWNILFIPMAVTVFLDYHVFRKQHLDLKALYDTSPSGPYYFWKGWNPAFLVTLALGALFYLTLNDPIHLDPHWYFKYASASLPTYAFCCILYYALTKYWIIPKGWGGYPELPKERASRAAEVARLQRTI